jgi:hypothetical protein
MAEVLIAMAGSLDAVAGRKQFAPAAASGRLAHGFLASCPKTMREN